MDLINSLPEEVMCMVFDRLDLESVKNASLACQRWNGIIFLSPYIQRFSLKIYITYNRCFPQVPGMAIPCSAEMKMNQLIKIMRKSNRCYRKLNCLYLPDDGNDDTSRRVWAAIHPKVTMHLNSMSFSGNMTSTAFSLITEAIPSILGLRWLKLFDISERRNAQDIIPTLQSSSVMDLELLSIVKCRLHMPQLERFKGPLSALYPLHDSPGSFRLSNLKHLIVTLKQECVRIITADPSIFRRMTRLKFLKLEGTFVRLPRAILLNVCDACTTLSELFIDGFNPSHGSDLQNLSKLINLRILAIRSTPVGTKAIDLSKLNQLETLYLINISNVAKLPMSIRALKIYVDIESGVTNIHKYLSTSPQLKELNIIIKSWNRFNLKRNVTNEILKALPFLKYLEVLMIDGGFFTESNFRHISAPLDHLRKLVFKNSIVDLNRSFLNNCFPNLKDLKFINCNTD